MEPEINPETGNTLLRPSNMTVTVSSFFIPKEGGK